MVRGCSGSDSEEERHDRFKSERTKSAPSAPLFRSNLPNTLDDYSKRTRSPHRSNHKSCRRLDSASYRSRNTRDERKPSPFSRNDRSHSRDRARSRQMKSYKEHDDRWDLEKNSVRVKKSREKSTDKEKKRSKETDQRHKGNGYSSICDRKKSSSKDKHKESVKRTKSEEIEEITKIEDKNIEIDPDPVCMPRYYEIPDESAVDSQDSVKKKPSSSDEKTTKKHKKSKSDIDHHESSKKHRKEKKHKKKHSKKKSGSESETKLDDETLIIENDTTGDTENEDQRLSTSVEKEVEEGELSGSEPEQFFGPALPPGVTRGEKVYGPSGPTEDYRASTPTEELGASMEEDWYGPALPPSVQPPPSVCHLTVDLTEDPDVIGPLPTGLGGAAQAALESRASILRSQMDNKLSVDGEMVPKREAWMTELPEARRAALGLPTARKFRNNPAPDMTDRSSWTDSPEERARKERLQEMGILEDKPEDDSRRVELLEKNREMEELSKKCKKRGKSLLEMHQKEIKMKKKKEEKERGDEKPERRPFSREVDLQSNRFDEAQKKSILKKAQLLNTRFSVGESKYL